MVCHFVVLTSNNKDFTRNCVDLHTQQSVRDDETHGGVSEKEHFPIEPETESETLPPAQVSIIQQTTRPTQSTDYSVNEWQRSEVSSKI